MRKIWILFLSVLMTLTFAACGASEAGNTAQKPGSAKPAAEQQSKAEKTDVAPAKTGKTLVAYFSCTGNTKALAETAAKAIGADLYEIVPEKAYTAEDLNYNDESTRATVEQKNDNARPALKDKNANIAAYDKIVLAYPIWWGQAPRILDTFVESYDFSGKTIVPICTSGGSDIGSSADYLKSITHGSADWKTGKLFSSHASAQEIGSWLKELGIGK